jgi:hypothetical protein
MQAETKSAVPQSATPAGTTESGSHLALHQLRNTLDSYADRMALRFAGPTALVAGLLTWALNWGRDPIPFVSDGFGFGFGILFFVLSIVIAFFVAAICFVLGVRYRNRLVAPDMRRSWVLPVAPIALAYALVTMLLVTIVLEFIDAAFKQLALPAPYAVLLIGLSCGVVAYYVANRTMRITVRAVLDVFVIILLTGIALSAIGIDKPRWWERSFSFLGTASSNERSVFNATLVFAGILFVILQQFFMDDFIVLRNRGLLTVRKTRWIRGSLIAMGVLMATVGLIPFGGSMITDTMHDFSAYGLAGILLVYMVAVRWALPYFSREFYLMTWFMVAVLLAALALHLLGSINVVGIELIAFALGGAWFLMFVKNVELFVEQTDGDSEPVNGSA